MPLRHLSLGALLLVAACGTTPESHNIRLDLTNDVPPVASLRGSLQIQPFNARGLINERRLVYSDAQSAGERKQSASFLWEEYPSQAATLVAVQAFRSAHVAQAVFPPDQPNAADYSLSARLDRFELEQNGMDSSARVALDVTIVKNDIHQIVLTGRYCARQPIAAGDGESIERAFDEAYRQTLFDLTRDIGQMNAGSNTASAC